MPSELSSLALLRLSPLILPFPPPPPPPLLRTLPRSAAGKVRSHGAAQDPALLRRPLVSAPSPAAPYASSSSSDEDGDEDDGVGVVAVAAKPEDDILTGSAGLGLCLGVKPRSRRGRSRDEDWVDWEDLILQDTVPLVGSVRMILHSGKYVSGDRLSPEHENFIMERLLLYHPESEEKIGSGIDYITMGFHPEFENSRCLFIVRDDGELVDFSYWKCIKGFIRKKYPLHADTFILRHFRRRKYNE